MAYRIPKKWSLASLLDYNWSVEAGLEAAGLAGDAAKWAAFEERVLAERETRDAARKAHIKAAAAQRRKDHAWDTVIRRIGTQAFADANRDAKKAPYVLLFGAVRPSDAVDLGAVKATRLGAELAAKMRALKLDKYTALATELDAASDALEAADKARRARSIEARTHNVRRIALLEDAEALVGATQIAILTALPDERGLVRAILSPRRDPTSVEREGPAEPDPDPDPT